MKRCVNEITQLRDDIDQHRKVCKYSWLKFKSNYSSLVHHDRVRSRSDCRRTDPPHNTTRTPWPTLSFFFLLSSIVTQRSSLTFDLLLKRHESDLVRSQSTLLSEQSEEFRLFPLQFHGLPQGTRHIYIYIYTLPADTILVSCSGNLQQLTGDVVAKYPRRDDSAVRAE